MKCIYYALVIVVIQWKSVYSLECLSCHQIDDPHSCNTTISCPDKQVCFLNVQGGMYSLGCADNQHCGGVAGPGIVGRDINIQQELKHHLVARQSSSCLECCSSDVCNSDLCKHPKPTKCVDDEAMDCARLNTIFHICSDIQQASLVCPKFCDLCTLVNGNWTVWTTWSNCDVTCGKGFQTRSRSCTNPAPENGGRDCIGNATETKLCKRDTCPVHGDWSTWSKWGSCSVTCDVGMQRRDRSCSNPYPSIGGNHCFGESRDDRICLPGSCSDGGWSSWSSWGTCTETCGGGMRFQTRTCTNPKPSLIGKQCEGNSERNSLCNKQTCPEHKVAFTAYGVKGSSTVIFPSIFENYGNGYDNSTGKFTCSVPGIYIFSFQLSKRYGSQYNTDLVQCYLEKNSISIVGAIQDPYTFGDHDNDKGGYSLSLSGTFHLSKNDTVNVGSCSGIGYIYTDIRSSFTGVLVTPDN